MTGSGRVVTECDRGSRPAASAESPSLQKVDIEQGRQLLNVIMPALADDPRQGWIVSNRGQVTGPFRQQTPRQIRSKVIGVSRLTFPCLTQVHGPVSTHQRSVNRTKGTRSRLNAHVLHLFLKSDGRKAEESADVPDDPCIAGLEIRKQIHMNRRGAENLKIPLADREKTRQREIFTAADGSLKVNFPAGILLDLMTGGSHTIQGIPETHHDLCRRTECLDFSGRGDVQGVPNRTVHKPTLAGDIFKVVHVLAMLLGAFWVKVSEMPFTARLLQDGWVDVGMLTEHLEQRRCACLGKSNDEQIGPPLHLINAMQTNR